MDSVIILLLWLTGALGAPTAAYAALEFGRIEQPRRNVDPFGMPRIWPDWESRSKIPREAPPPPPPPQPATPAEDEVLLLIEALTDKEE